MVWNKGLTKSDPRVQIYVEKGRKTRLKNHSYNAWNKGLTRDVDDRIIKNYTKAVKTRKRKGNYIAWNRGLTKHTDERVRKNAESVKATHWTKKLSPSELNERMSKMRLSQNFPKKFTSIEKAIFNTLSSLNIPFTPHKSFWVDLRSMHS